MEIKLVTGMSGAGKSTITKYFEDKGYVCHDNFPAKLIPTYIEMKEFNKILFVIDARTEKKFNTLIEQINLLKKDGIDFSMIFMDASDSTIIQRYREERKMHPLQQKNNISLIGAVKQEREMLGELKKIADYVFDTSHLSQEELSDKVAQVFEGGETNNKLMITCMSFGYKHGVPDGVDIMYDVRCFKNPYWVKELKELTGLDKAVIDYIMSFDESKEFMENIYKMIDFLVPIYIREGKRQLVIAFGCTGGHHRSVCFAKLLYEHLEKQGYTNINILHKNIEN